MEIKIRSLFSNIKKFLFFTFIFLLAFSLFGIGKVKAASLTTVAVALSPSTATTATTATLTFTPATAITNGSIINVSYDTGFTGGASLTDADVTVAATNISSTVESSFAAGYFKSTLTTSGSVTTTVTITIGSTNKLTTPAAGNYNFSVVVDVGGAGTTFDSGAGLAYVANENQVTITATVGPVLDMELYQTGSMTLLSNPNTCALGALTVNTINTCSYDVGYGTNNSSGVTVKIASDGKLNTVTTGTYSFADASGNIVAGTEAYGVRITGNGSGCGTVTDASTYGTTDSAVPQAAATFFSNNSTCNGTSGSNQAEHITVTHKATAGLSTPVGSYDQLVTYTAFTN